MKMKRPTYSKRSSITNKRQLPEWCRKETYSFTKGINNLSFNDLDLFFRVYHRAVLFRSILHIPPQERKVGQLQKQLSELILSPPTPFAPPIFEVPFRENALSTGYLKPLQVKDIVGKLVIFYEQYPEYSESAASGNIPSQIESAVYHETFDRLIMPHGDSSTDHPKLTLEIDLTGSDRRILRDLAKLLETYRDYLGIEAPKNNTYTTRQKTVFGKGFLGVFDLFMWEQIINTRVMDDVISDALGGTPLSGNAVRKNGVEYFLEILSYDFLKGWYSELKEMPEYQEQISKLENAYENHLPYSTKQDDTPK